MTNTQPVPNNLRSIRKKAGLRQVDVAHFLGLESTDRISRWENGAAVPHLINLFKLSAAYKVSPQQLYGELYKTIEDGTYRPISQAAELFAHSE